MKVLGKIRRVVRWIVVAFVVVSLLQVLLLRFVPVYVTPLMLIRCAQQVWHGKEITLKHHWVPLSEMAEELPVAVMCTEDARFLEHSGFDFAAIRQAAKDNAQGKRQRGASTISQQTAKNVFLWPGRSWLRKGLEAYYTMLIELTWGKRRIMEVYLNSIEMGNGIYGAEAAAQQHFGIKASDLQRRHCALIAISLPSPLKMNAAQPSPYMLRRQTRVMNDIAWAMRNKVFQGL